MLDGGYVTTIMNVPTIPHTLLRPVNTLEFIETSNGDIYASQMKSVYTCRTLKLYLDIFGIYKNINFNEFLNLFYFISHNIVEDLSFRLICYIGFSHKVKGF